MKRPRPDYAGAHARRLQLFRDLLDGQENDNGTPNTPFWDAVVLTAGDESQREIYEGAVAGLIEAGLVPTLATKYHVLVDPPGPKIGSGGSTLVVLDALSKAYGAHFKTMKILLLHAGGYSKRLPHVSACGKIFATLPIENTAGRAMTVFELKLVLYADFPRRMDPGIFLASADTIESFTETDFDFTLPGITALAHPSSPEIGTTHGVFVLDSPPFVKPGPAEVRTFLHKPSIPTMRSQNALFDRSGQETVLTDSVFFTHHSVYERLLRLHGELHPVSVELEAYGDFLSPLGRNPNRSYLESKSNLVDPYSANSVMSARTSVFEHLAGTPLHALPLEHSVFYHFGTTDEYLEHLCFGSKAKEGTVDRVGEDVVFTNRTGTNATFAPPGVTLMNTTFAHKGVQLNGVGHCVIENVVFGPNVLELNIGARSILSNLHVDLVVPGALNIPRGSYIFGVAVAEGFCSFAIDVDDDVKKTYPSRSEVRLWAGKLDANDVISLSGLEMNEALDGAPGNENSIWTAKIWPVLPSRMASFDFALGVAVLAASDASNRSHVHAVLPKDTQMMSIADAMEKKAPMELLRWQRACVGH